MLSSCWFTTPFTGCFSATSKGLGGGVAEATQDTSNRIIQSEERSPRRLLRPAPRSRSEGPLATSDIDDEFIHYRASEYKTQFAKSTKSSSGASKAGAVKVSGGGPVSSTTVKCSVRSYPIRGPETTPLLMPEKPAAVSSTKSQPVANGFIGSHHSSGGKASGAAVGADDIGGGGGTKDQTTPRKSKSMGRISGDKTSSGGVGVSGGPGVGEGNKVAAPSTMATVDGKKQDGGGANEDAPARGPWHGHRRVPSDGVAWRRSKGLDADLSKNAGMDVTDHEFKSYKSEYRKKFRPFSQYQYVDGKFHIVKAEDAPAAGVSTGGGAHTDATDSSVARPNAWYKEVLELRKQAGQYRHRGWGVEMASERLSEIYNQQAVLWEQVSRRSSLQALSLASASPSSRPISKAEKEISNSRRSSPVKQASSKERPSTAPPKPKPAGVHVSPKKSAEKSSKDVRHHYERTTGSGEDGLLITSPSRDNIEPTVPDWSVRRSSRKTPPVTSPVKGRSVSVEPQSRSPKRSSRPPSGHPPPVAKTNAERRPRPTSLASSARRKGTTSHEEQQPKKPPVKKSHDQTSASPKKAVDFKSREDKRRSIGDDGELKKDKEKEVMKDAPKDAGMEAVKESSLTGRKSTPEPRFDPEKYEPVVKTPPEPTRVKSPDQVMVKSPDPVNWTVPLDTGKTFTVTQNIPEGESSRATPSDHRQPFESRPRQTPEPTKIYQGSLAGTPITQATTATTASLPEETKPSPQAVPEKVSAVPVAEKPATPPSKFDATVPTSKPIVPETKKDERTLPGIPEVKPDEKIEEVVPVKDTAVKQPSSLKETPKMEPIPESMTSSILNDIPSSPTFHSSGASQDPMTMSMGPDSLKSACADPMAQSMGPDSLKGKLGTTDPMAMSMGPDSFKGISSSVDPMTMSMGPDSLSSATDPMAMSMGPDSLKSISGAADPMAMSMGPDSLNKSLTSDPMTTSVFGTINGMNGKSPTDPSPTKPEQASVTKDSEKVLPPASSQIGARTVPGTNMRCLDDPSFMFDQQQKPPSTKESSLPGSVRVLEAPEEPPVAPQSKVGGGMRVLEAPESPTSTKSDQPPTNVHENPVAVKPSPYRVLEAPLDEVPTIGKSSPYRVLEAPDTSYYPPQQQQPPSGASESKPPALVSPSSGRTVTDALDKARSRFDSFWGGNKEKDAPSNV